MIRLPNALGISFDDCLCQIMTSPYLNKPKRSLGDALRDRGLTSRDVGLSSDSDTHDSKPEAGTHPQTIRRRSIHVFWMSVTFAVLAWLAIELGRPPNEQQTPNLLEVEAERLESSFAPAAGDN